MTVSAPVAEAAGRLAEREIVVAAIHGGSIPECCIAVRPDHLTDRACAAAWGVLRRLEAEGQPIATDTVLAALEAVPWPAESGASDGPEWLAEITAGHHPLAVSVEAAARVILDGHRRRQELHAAAALVTAIRTGDAGRADSARHRLGELLGSGGPTAAVADAAPTRADALWPGLAELLEVRGAGALPCVPTNLPGLDGLLGGGLPAGQPSLLCAPPGSGKTTVALGWALAHARRPARAVVWSLELPASILLARLVCLERGAPWAKVLAGDCPDDVKATGERLAGLDLHVVEQRGEQGWARVHRLLGESCGDVPALLVIDYLQLLADGTGLEQRGAVEQASGWAMDLAHDTGAAVLAISSTSRASYDLAAEGRPDSARVLAMARDSGRLEFDAAAVLGIVPLPRDPGAEPSRYRRAWLCAPKVRLGQSGEVAVEIDGLAGHVVEIDAAEMGKQGAGGARDLRVEADILAAVAGAQLRGDRISGMRTLAARVTGRRQTVESTIRRLLTEGRLRGGGGRPFEVVEVVVEDEP